MTNEQQKIIKLLEEIEDDLNQIRNKDELYTEVHTWLWRHWSLKSSVDDLAADIRKTILNMRKSETLQAMEEIKIGFEKLQTLKNTNGFALELIEHNYPTELRDLDIDFLTQIFQDYAERIRNY